MYYKKTVAALMQLSLIFTFSISMKYYFFKIRDGYVIWQLKKLMLIEKYHTFEVLSCIKYYDWM